MNDHNGETLTFTGGFDPYAAATGPLKFTYVLTPQVSLVTNVFGTNRDQASVAIMSGNTTVWVGSMTQGAPTVKPPATLIIGDTTIDNGSFTLTIPTEQQDGNVFFSAKVGSAGNPPVQFNAIIAQWPLNSSA